MKVKLYSLLIKFICVVVSCSESTPNKEEIPVPDDYTLVWNDEFDYSGLPDNTKWNYDTGNHGWGNQELQNYLADTQETASVDNGVLTITAMQIIRGQEKEFISARMVTRDKGDWLYGRIDVRAKLPRGRGTWPAIWMLPTDWEYGNWPKSGEIDIMEHVGYNQGTIYGTVHTGAFNHTQGTQKGGSIMAPMASDEFLVYSILWDELKIDFFIDNRLYFTFQNTGKSSNEWPFDKRFHLILNIAVGGAWGGAQGVDESVFPQNMQVDYVRVFQKNK